MLPIPLTRLCSKTSLSLESLQAPGTFFDDHTIEHDPVLDDGEDEYYYGPDLEGDLDHP